MKKKGRGLSYDEKKQKMLKIFHNTKSVFNYDEIEKLSIKAGIPFPNVKEILNALKADYLIESEKIGAGVFYWSFPSKALQIYEDKIAKSKKQIEFYTQELEKMEGQLQEGQIGRQQTQQRQEIEQLFKQLALEESQLTKEVNKYIRFDPERVELIKKQNKQLKDAINLQTDNLEQIKKYIKRNQPGTKDAQIEQQYGIPIDLDYLQ